MCHKSKSFTSGNQLKSVKHLDLFISDSPITSLPSLSKNVSNGDYFGVFDIILDEDTNDTTVEDKEDFSN
jgi:hypothetical protein